MDEAIYLQYGKKTTLYGRNITLYEMTFSIFLGSSNSFTLTAVTKHGIGNSRPSRVMKVKCPPQPSSVEEVYQIDTDQIGIILLTWQIPTKSGNQTDTKSFDKNDETTVQPFQTVDSGEFF